MRQPTGKLRPPPVTTNLCRGRCLHRPGNPASPQGPGRDKSRPYDRRKARTQPGNGNPAAPQTSVGDDARIVPHPRGGANARGRDKSRPYDQRKVRSHRGTALSTVSQTSVGDDARTAPAGTFRRPKTAGPALRPEIVPGTPQEGSREGHGPPLRINFVFRAKPDKRSHPGDRRAGCPHPAGPCGGANVSILNRQCAAGVHARPTRQPETAAEGETGGFSTFNTKRRGIAAAFRFVRFAYPAGAGRVIPAPTRACRRARGCPRYSRARR